MGQNNSTLLNQEITANSLEAAQNEDYEALKREILAQVGLSPVSIAQQFTTWTFNDSTPVCAQTAHFSLLACLWFPRGNQIAERVFIDRMLRLSWRLRAVSMKNPTSLATLMEVIKLAKAPLACDTVKRAAALPLRMSHHW